MEIIVFSIADLIKNAGKKVKNSIIAQRPNNLFKVYPKTAYIIIIILITTFSRQTKLVIKNNILIHPQWRIRNKINGPPKIRGQPTNLKKHKEF